MRNLILRQGRVIDPASRRDEIADVLIIGGQVAEIGPSLEIGAELRQEIEDYDATGKWVVPGLIDMHVHLREPGEEYKETIETGTQAAVAGGFTAVACMPNTKPVNDNAAVTRFILDRARERGACRVLPVGAISRGSQGETLCEFGELREAGAVAVSDDGRPVTSSLLMRRALEYARVFDLLVISHAEDPSLSAGGLMNEGYLSTLLGLRGIPSIAEQVMIARDLLLAEYTQSRVHIAHVSTAGSVDLIRQAKDRGVAVTCETAPHYFTLTDQYLSTFDPVYKVNPPLRSAEDVQAIKRGLADGTIDVIATDHAPHSTLEKDIEFEYAANGMIGLESAVPLVLGLVRQGVLSPLQALAKVTEHPARALGIAGGRLQRSAPADLTVIDPAVTFRLDSGSFRSASRNCPFHGWEVQGMVVMTLVQGRTVYRSQA
jgi:dihydroorotase